MADKSIGFIETFGLAACVAAADAAVKSANVKLLGYEYAKGDGMCTVKVEGNVGACKAAIEAGRRAAEAVGIFYRYAAASFACQSHDAQPQDLVSG